MKELSIEEKAKRFDEILARAKGANLPYYKEDIMSKVKEFVDYLLPELKESEDDERIRKELIAILKGQIPYTSEEDAKRYIAWLEKQSDEPDWCHHKVDLSDCSEEYRKAYYDGWNNCNMQHSQCESEKSDVLKCLINGMKFYYEDNEEATWGTEKFSIKVKDILSWLEKQGKILRQRADVIIANMLDDKIDGIQRELIEFAANAIEAPWLEIIKSADYYAQRIRNIIDEQDEQKSADKIEPKPAWSRGDEQNLNAALGYIDDEYLRRWLKDVIHTKYDKSAWSEEDERIALGVEQLCNCASLLNIAPDKIDKIRTWFKSLKERVQPQPKQEWSEEDMAMLDSAIAFVEHSAFTTIGKGKGSVVAWLKSLKERCTWKPSDKQIKALSDINITGCISYAGQGQELINLYQDLKKLRG